MKVTKVIKDYVKREVEKAYEQREKEAQAMYDNPLNELNKKLEEIAIEANAKALAILEGTGFESTRWDHELITIYGIHNPGLREKKRDIIRAIEEEEERVIENILVTLELGGTKADLDRMISEL